MTKIKGQLILCPHCRARLGLGTGGVVTLLDWPGLVCRLETTEVQCHRCKRMTGR